MIAKKKSTTPTKGYIALWSECGGLEQLAVLNDHNTNVHQSVDAAKKEVSKYVQNQQAYGGLVSGSYYVVEIVAEGTPGEIVWK